MADMTTDYPELAYSSSNSSTQQTHSYTPVTEVKNEQVKDNEQIDPTCKVRVMPIIDTAIKAWVSKPVEQKYDVSFSFSIKLPSTFKMIGTGIALTLIAASYVRLRKN